MVNDRFSWILLWIMTFRTKYNILETATDSLIKFMKLVLNEINRDMFNTFLDSLYLVKNVLKIKDRFQSFVPYTNCHKLYLKEEVENFHQGRNLVVMKCQHIEFLNLSTRQTNICDTPLA